MEKPPSIHIYILPNLITTANLFCGFFATIYAINGNYLTSAYALVAAAIFDLLDGRVARLTHSTSKFGMQYDSLCDLVSFGMAPGILLYLWALQPFGRIGWLASFMFTACGALRLARFNVQQTVAEKGFFQGLPIPMAAGIVAGSVLAFDNLGKEGERSYWILAMTILLAIVMVSNFRYRSFKDIDFRQRLPFWFLVLGTGVIAIVAWWPEVMIFVLFLAYAVLGAIFGVLRIGKTPRMRYIPTAENEPSDIDLEPGDELETAHKAPNHPGGTA